MKKFNLILTAVTVLVLAAMSCSLQFVPPEPPPPLPPPTSVPGNFDPGNPVPQGSGPGNVGPENPGPQGPMPGNPGPGEPDPQGLGPNPNDGIGIPGGGAEAGQILLFTADRTTLNKGECVMLHWETQGGFGVSLNEEPAEHSGQKQVCPTQITIYRLTLDLGSQVVTREIAITVNGSNQNPNPIATTVTPKTKKPDITVTPVTPSSPNIQILPVTLVVANLNLAIVNIFVRPGDGHVMATFRNAGNVNLNTTTTLKCANGTGNGALVSTKTVTLNLKPGEIFNQDTGWTKQTAATLTCSFTPPSGDTHHNDDSMTTTIQ